MNFFNKLQSMGGNYVSRLGGADILSQDQLQQLDPQQLAFYNQQKEAAKTAGMRELASRLSDAFAGRDIVGRAQERQKTQSEIRNANLLAAQGPKASTLQQNVKYIDSLYKQRDKFRDPNSKGYKDLSIAIRNAEAGLGAYKYDAERLAQIEAQKKAAEQGRIGQTVLTDAQIKSDEEFGKWYTTEWLVKGGGSTEATYLESLKGVRDTLVDAEKSGESITGVSQGVLTKFPMAQAFFNPEGAVVQDRIAGVAQLSLKAILGGQFSEREGELLIQRAYNPLLSEAENIERLTQLINRIEKAENYKNDAARYYQENNTLAGFKPKKYGAEEFRSDLESFYEQDMNILDDDALEREYLNTDANSIYFQVLQKEVDKRYKKQ
jgi:hypothetical protein